MYFGIPSILSTSLLCSCYKGGLFRYESSDLPSRSKGDQNTDHHGWQGREAPYYWVRRARRGNLKGGSRHRLHLCFATMIVGFRNGSDCVDVLGVLYRAKTAMLCGNIFMYPAMYLAFAYLYVFASQSPNYPTSAGTLTLNKHHFSNPPGSTS
jgi:hypothetical protein